MKYLKLFILFILLFLSNKVYALETTTMYRNTSFSNNGFLYTTSSSLSGTIYNGSVNTVYSDPSYGITFFLNKGTVPGKVYKIRINFNDYDFLKSNTYNTVEITNGDNCAVVGFQLINQGGSNNQAKGVDITYTCLSSGAYTGVSIAEYIDGSGYKRITTINWRINNTQWEQVDDNDAEQIIANASINTQNIINNNNENTQDIIDNQNEIAQQQEEQQKVCTKTIIDSSNIIENGYLSSDGTKNSSQNQGITDYIEIGGRIKVIANYGNATHNCFYTDNKTFISCVKNSVLSLNEELTIPNNAKYVRFSININDNIPRFDMEICKNGNQALSDDINDLNDTIKDDNVGGATSEAGDFITGFDTNTFGLTSIITAPLNLIQSITSSTCTDLQIPLPYLNNKKLTLPCMTPIYQSTFGSLFTLYQTITFGIIAYWICVRIFNMVKDFKNPDHDEIEVVDL